MKKKLYLLLVMIAMVVVAKGSDTIPNAGFERWFNNGWFYYPSGWMTNNSQLLAPSVIPDSDAYTGDLALGLNYQGALQPHAWCNFSLTTHPVNLGGYVKCQIGPNDTGIVVVRIFYNHQVVDSGYGVFHGGINPNYSTFIVPISQHSQFADSCEISLTGGTLYLSSISVDDLQFDFSLSLPMTILLYPSTNVYPNPFHDNVIFDYEPSKFTPTMAEIFDMTGRRINIPIEIAIDPGAFYITDHTRYRMIFNTTSLREGSYLIIIHDHDKVRSYQVIKN